MGSEEPNPKPLYRGSGTSENRLLGSHMEGVAGLEGPSPNAHLTSSQTYSLNLNFPKFDW